MAFDVFLEIKGIAGESTDKAYAGKIEVLSTSLGASNPATVGSGVGGASGGRVTWSSIAVSVKESKATAKLLEHVCNGKHIDDATFTYCRATGDKSVFLVIKLTKVFVESVQHSSSAGGDDRPSVSFSLAYGKIEYTYTQYGTDGKKIGDAKTSWNVETNTV